MEGDNAMVGALPKEQIGFFKLYSRQDVATGRSQHNEKKPVGRDNVKGNTGGRPTRA
jgi:hypothetical protein